jgi:hypothetical protein
MSSFASAQSDTPATAANAATQVAGVASHLSPTAQEFVLVVQHICEGLSNTPHTFNLDLFANQLIDLYKVLPLPERDLLAQHLLQHPPAVDQVPFYTSLLYALTKHPGFVVQLAQALPRYTHSLQAFHNLIWQIKRWVFRDAQAFGMAEREQILDELLPAAYRPYCRTLVPVLQQRVTMPKTKTAGIKKVAIVTGQFLGDRHAPSRQCLIMAGALTQLGLEAHIINTNAMPTDNPLHVIDAFIGNCNTQFQGSQNITATIAEFDEFTFWLYSNTHTPYSLTKMADCLAYLHDAQIDAVIFAGEELFLPDALAGHLPTLFLATGQGFPLPLHEFYWMWGGNAQALQDRQSAEKAGLLEHYGELKGIVVMQDHGPGTSRQALGIPQDAVAFAVVGNRLSHELDEAFMAVCQTVLAAQPNAFLVFVGNADLPIVAQQLPATRVTCLPYQPHLFDVLACCDAFLNPFREGGATGGTMAAYLKKPVITLSNCHNGCLVGPHAFDTLAAFTQAAVQVATDAPYASQLGQAMHDHVFDQTNTDTVAQMVELLHRLQARLL